MNRPDQPTRLVQLAMLVHQIPCGRCASYGDLGKALPNPVSGFLAGKWMASLESGAIEIPWWRVVKKDGTIALFDRDPKLGMEQKSKLESEGVPISRFQVDMSKVRWNEFETIDI